MSAPAQAASMPPNVDLDLNCQIVFEAVDPTTGAPVSDVLIDNALIRVETNLGAGAGGSLSSGAFVLVPGPNS